MADKKISALAAASTPLAGTEVLPIVQSNTTVKVSVANLTAGRDVSGKVITATDNFVVSTAGKGIDFSANTSAAGMTSELLTWYEEGTWTPAFTGDGGSAGTFAATVFGTYTRIGRIVHLRGSGVITDAGSWTGRVFITGVPFAGATFQYGSAWFNNVTTTDVINCTPAIGEFASNYVQFIYSTIVGGGDSLRWSTNVTTSTLRFTLCYQV